MAYPLIKVTGDTSLAVIFGDEISNEMNEKVRSFDEAITQAKIPGVYETVPTYCQITIHYAPEVIRYNGLRERLEQLLQETHHAASEAADVIEIPVLYGGEYGPDLDFVAKHNNLSRQEVIRIHCEPEYLIYMLGFTPGFPYLGGMDERIATPRLTSPREKIPAGSVGIAGKQTGVYPMDTPGGWQLIGRTPLTLYDPRNEKPILLDAGMHVKFVPVTQKEYDDILDQVEDGVYVPKIYKSKAKENA
ncbi:MAG: 5-oxoprolinase subunit PxpB [Lachnospiraceae bacterium]|nr:5-oxoprolinase subunit PxpB [Lachnospiraceae bacterium]